MNGTADVDLELWDGDTKVIGWYGEIDEGSPGTDAYQGIPSSTVAIVVAKSISEALTK